MRHNPDHKLNRWTTKTILWYITCRETANIFQICITFMLAEASGCPLNCPFLLKRYVKVCRIEWDCNTFKVDQRNQLDDRHLLSYQSSEFCFRYQQCIDDLRSYRVPTQELIGWNSSSNEFIPKSTEGNRKLIDVNFPIKSMSRNKKKSSINLLICELPTSPPPPSLALWFFLSGARNFGYWLYFDNWSWISRFKAVGVFRTSVLMSGPFSGFCRTHTHFIVRIYLMIWYSSNGNELTLIRFGVIKAIGSSL